MSLNSNVLHNILMLHTPRTNYNENYFNEWSSTRLFIRFIMGFNRGSLHWQVFLDIYLLCLCENNICRSRLTSAGYIFHCCINELLNETCILSWRANSLSYIMSFIFSGDSEFFTIAEGPSLKPCCSVLISFCPHHGHVCPKSLYCGADLIGR